MDHRHQRGRCRRPWRRRRPGPRPSGPASSRAATMPKASSMPPPPKSPTRFNGGTGAASARPSGHSAPADGDVVDVVPGRRRPWDRPGPTRSCARRPAPVAGQAVLRPDPEPLGHAGSEALDQPVGRLDQVQHQLDRVGILEIDADRRPARLRMSQCRRGATPAPPRLARPPRAPPAPGGGPARRRRPASCRCTGAGPIPASSMILIPLQRSTSCLAMAGS